MIAAPRYSPRLRAVFARYAQHYVGRHFTAVRVARDGMPPVPAEPTVLYANHASWWDPLLLLVIARAYYPRTRIYAPIDAAALERYPLLERCGFFGIEVESVHGARQLLAAGRRVLAEGSMLAITAQGRFGDVRERPVVLKRGLARLLAAVPRAVAVPVALEYPFWNERKPEALLSFGHERVTAAARPAHEIHANLEQALERTLDGLAAAAMTRDPQGFETVVAGRAGVGFLEDLPSRLRAWLAGRSFDAAHGAIEREGQAR